MTELATLFRSAQLYAHAAHNLASGSTFFADHEYLGELYGAYESAYDATVERCIGLGIDINLATIAVSAASRSLRWGSDKPEAAFSALLDIERSICSEVCRQLPFATPGTANLLGQFADDSEARQYKLQRRTMALQSPT